MDVIEGRTDIGRRGYKVYKNGLGPLADTIWAAADPKSHEKLSETVFGSIDHVKDAMKEATGGWDGVDAHYRNKYAKEIDAKEAAAARDAMLMDLGYFDKKRAEKEAQQKMEKVEGYTDMGRKAYKVYKNGLGPLADTLWGAIDPKSHEKLSETVFGSIDHVKDAAKEATGGWDGVDAYYKKKYAKEVQAKEKSAKDELLAAAGAMSKRNAERFGLIM